MRAFFIFCCFSLASAYAGLCQTPTWQWQPPTILGRSRVVHAVPEPSGGMWVSVLADYQGSFGVLSQGTAWVYYLNAQGTSQDSFSLGPDINVGEIAVSANGTLWLAGHYNNTLNLPGGGSIGGPNGNPAAVLLKYDDINGLVVADTLDDVFGTGSQYYCLAADDSGNVYVGGAIALNATVVKYNANGGRVWQQVFEEANHSAVSDIFIDTTSGNALTVCGYFQSRLRVGTQLLQEVYGIFKAGMDAGGTPFSAEGLGDVGTSIFSGRVVSTPGNQYWVTEFFDSLIVQGQGYPASSNGNFALINESFSAPPSWVVPSPVNSNSSGVELGLGNTLTLHPSGGFGSGVYASASVSGTIEWAPGQQTISPNFNNYVPALLYFERTSGAASVILQGTTPTQFSVRNFTHGHQWMGENLLLYGEQSTDTLQFGDAILDKTVGSLQNRGWLVAFSETALSANEPAAGGPQFALFPNPANGQTTVQWGAQHLVNEVNVLDAQGRTVYRQPANGTQIHFDTQGWPAGLYWVAVKGSNGTTGQRLLVQ